MVTLPKCQGHLDLVHCLAGISQKRKSLGAAEHEQGTTSVDLELRKDLQASGSWSIASRELELGHYMQARSSKHRVEK